MKTIQLPDDVYQQASQLAQQDHVSVDKLVAVLVHEGVGEWSRIKDRAARGSLESLKRVLAKVGDAHPDAMDRL